MFNKGVDAIVESVSKELNKELSLIAAPSYMTDDQLNSEVPYFREWRELRAMVMSEYSKILAKELVTHKMVNGIVGQLEKNLNPELVNVSMTKSYFGASEAKYKKEIKALAEEVYAVFLLTTNTKAVE